MQLPFCSVRDPQGDDGSVKGSGLLLLLAAGILAQPTSVRESGVREEFQNALNFVDKGRPREAVVAFRSIVERHPDVSEAWNNLATLEAAMGDLDAARLSLRKALDCQQATQVALRNLDKVVGRMARAAWDSALSSASSIKDGPKLDLVRELPQPVDTTAMRREGDSLRLSIKRFARERDSLQGLRKNQDSYLDSIRQELGRREASLENLLVRRRQDFARAERLRRDYQKLSKRSDSLDGILKLRGQEEERLKGQLTMRTREADSLRKALVRREAEGDSLRRTLARVEQERIEARKDLLRRTSEVARLKSETEGARVASIGAADAPVGEAGKDPLATILTWADAWSRRDVEGYLAFYSEDFAPKDGRAAWEELRRKRVGINDSIHVGVNEAVVKRLPSGDVAVSFRQTYESGQTRLTTRKRIVLRHEVPGWKILQEEGGAR